MARLEAKSPNLNTAKFSGYTVVAVREALQQLTKAVRLMNEVCDTEGVKYSICTNH